MKWVILQMNRITTTEYQVGVRKSVFSQIISLFNKFVEFCSFLYLITFSIFGSILIWILKMVGHYLRLGLILE